MAELAAAIRMKERGATNFVIYEKGASVPGTWRENTYPWLGCDTPAHSYAYSFALNPEWSACFALGPEIKAYFDLLFLVSPRIQDRSIRPVDETIR